MTCSLKIIPSTPIGAPQIVSSNVPMSGEYPTWVTGATYSIGDKVEYGAHVWRSTADGNINFAPASSPDKWLKVGAINRFRAFDDAINTQTKRADHISYTFAFGHGVSAVSVVNVTGGASARLQVTDSVLGTVYDKTVALPRSPQHTGWWSWYFGARRETTQAVFLDIPSIPTAQIQLDIYGSADLGVGVIMVGQIREFSMGVQMGARVGIQDFSRKERNEYGDLLIVERGFAKRASFSLLLRAHEVDALQDFLSTVRAKSCLWIGSGRYEATTVYGPYKSFEIVISYFDYSDCNLELEGLT